MTSEALMEICGGSEQLWWLGIYKPGNGVWSRPHSELHAEVMISVPDVAIMQSSAPDKVQRWVSHPSISLWKQLVGSGKHLIITDAKQLKTQHLQDPHAGWTFNTRLGYINTSNIVLIGKNPLVLIFFFMDENRSLRFDVKWCIHQGVLPLGKETLLLWWPLSNVQFPASLDRGKKIVSSHTEVWAIISLFH